jgi:hypothetical protein
VIYHLLTDFLRCSEPTSEHERLSFWTPLHQAVYHHAPVEVVQRLLDLGAFSKFGPTFSCPMKAKASTETLRTRTSEFTYPNMSPLDLAYHMEVYHLYDILKPVIQSPMPFDTLREVENKFHLLIHDEMGERVDIEKLYLPVLEVLTELDGDTIWFPINFGHESAVRLIKFQSIAANILTSAFRGTCTNSTTESYR